jgi:hypothetical protein
VIQHLSPDVAVIDPMVDDDACARLDSCAWHQEEMRTKLVGRYVAGVAGSAGHLPMSRLPLEEHADDDAYRQEVRVRHGGEVDYEVRKSTRRGYVVHPFAFATHVPDVVDINQSKQVRSGGPMRGAYLSSVEEHGGAPRERIAVVPPPCPLHYDYWWGLFAPEPGHRQGSVTTDERLLAYLRLRRNGNYLLYAQILGHGDHLREGVVYALHMQVMSWLLRRDSPHSRDVAHVIYGAWNSGGPGLQRWKARLLFAPALLVLPALGSAG